MAFGESIAADEGERFAGFAEEIRALQRRRTEKSGKAERALHVKQHVAAVGTFTVAADAPVQSGVFARQGQAWPVYARFSNGSSRRQGDPQPDVRGFAIKLVGVPGSKLIPGLEAELTQDFLLIDTPALPFATPDEFMQFVRAAKDGPGKLVPRMVKSFGLARTFKILWGTIRGEKVASFATHSFHTAAPIALGPSAAKLALLPLGSPNTSPGASGDDYLKQDLVARLKRGPLSWSLKAQLFVDQASTPIEDATVVWSGPWHSLGTLALPQQDLESARGQEIFELVNQLSFDPWHAIAEHRPLGSMMRARAVVYGVSVTARGAAAEPRSVLAP